MQGVRKEKQVLTPCFDSKFKNVMKSKSDKSRNPWEGTKIMADTPPKPDSDPSESSESSEDSSFLPSSGLTEYRYPREDTEELIEQSEPLKTNPDSSEYRYPLEDPKELPSNLTGRIMEYDALRKSLGVAIFLWFFFSVFGGHRFYLGKPFAWVMPILLIVGFSTTIVGVGFLILGFLGIWELIDLILLFGWVKEHNLKLSKKFQNN